MDIFNRYIVSWELSTTLETEFCCEALREALESGKPEYSCTDQGSQFTSDDYTSILKERKIKIGMDGKGQVIDNIFIERFWRTLKCDEVYTKCYESVEETGRSIGSYIDRHNRVKFHPSLGEYDTPFDGYRQMKMAVAS